MSRYWEVKEILDSYASKCYSESGSYSGCTGSFQAILTLLIIGEITPERALEVFTPEKELAQVNNDS